MLGLVCLGGLITAFLGLAMKRWLDVQNLPWRITRREFTFTMTLMLALVIPLTCWVGLKVALKNQATFYENWNGWELGVEVVREKCHQDGSMKHFWVEGRTRKVKGRSVYEEHKIPYTTEEWTFILHSSVGDVVLGEHYLPENPDKYRWRRKVSVKPAADTGYPPAAREARDRTEHNHVGPVTVRKPYTNYILSSQHTILRRTSSSLARYREAGLLPTLSGRPNSAGQTEQVYAMSALADLPRWQQALHRFNAALGQLQQGDLHLVIVDAGQVKDPDDYANAVLASWWAPELGRDGLAKNTIVLFLGVSQGRIAWARAHTGMPLGNEALRTQLQTELPGQVCTAANLLGEPQARVMNGKDVKVFPTDSTLERIMIKGPNRFQRVDMRGFDYLVWELQPTTRQQAEILAAVAGGAGVAWAACLWAGPGIWGWLFSTKSEENE